MEKIVLVDDEADIRRLVELRLRMAGFQILTAADGETGLQLIRAERPRIALLDLMMPSMDGFSVYTWLRGNPTTRRVPVIVVTAVSNSQVDMLKLPGVSAVIQKGQFTLASMTALIQRALNHKL